MKVRIKFPVKQNIYGIKLGDEFDVIRKKPADKFNKETRYIIQLGIDGTTPVLTNISERFVEEIND